ncbi:hypothetical protein [Bosea sp. BH3]|uniref:hypothetical protein n=1 Tax=Bosea sp. BH3 TaxID=2871701 RepID=UPI0021CAFC8A|nr:hypothetical protein [Bosea sp. BH3]MCU4180175.1 hypothetical protein [Bosea sp. BH3]
MAYEELNRNKKILRLVEVIKNEFDQSNWLELGLLTNRPDAIQNHPRLLRSLDFADSDYGGHVLSVVMMLVRADPNNLTVIEDYLQDKFGGGENVSSTPIVGRRIVFAPTVFQVPDAVPDPDLVSVMMPFDMSFSPVHATLVEASRSAGMNCLRADNIWEHSTIIQDIFGLIFRSFVVVCDFTGRNPNVFYEAGIAHTLGKHVIPITQNAEDIPFDLRHHRFIRYLNNNEGIAALNRDVAARLNYFVSERRG